MNETITQKISSYFNNNLDSFIKAVAEHLTISVSALIIAGVIGILCGCWCYQKQSSERWLVGFFQILRIIPSLAILFLLIPLMGTGIRPAMTALILLAIPPILMNTVTGLKSVPDFMIETARGLGMTERQVMWKVKIPLALPLILAGLKTAMIEIIASATLAAKIGAGGLGELIFTGLGLNRTDLLLIGGLSVALLSLISGFLLDMADRWIFKYKFKNS